MAGRPKLVWKLALHPWRLGGIKNYEAGYKIVVPFILTDRNNREVELELTPRETDSLIKQLQSHLRIGLELEHRKRQNNGTAS